MGNDNIIVVGGSHAGAQVAISLRQEGWKGRITLISSESHVPYHRPPLSKSYLIENKQPSDLEIRPASFYASANIELLLGTEVVGVDATKNCVTTNNGRSLYYKKLVLATGARVRKLTVPGHDLKGVLYLRTISDVEELRRHVGPDKKVVIVGGGYIGLEAAASMKKLGMQVTLVEAQGRILERIGAPAISDFFTRIHRAEGVEVLTEKVLVEIIGNETVRGVRFTDGDEIAADLVLVGIGVIPQDELAKSAGLKVDNGIVVHGTMQTSNPDIYAVGDCTIFYSETYERFVRLESVQNATDQAKAAAKAICGKPTTSSIGLPWFWSDQYDLKLQIAGLSLSYDDVVVRGDPCSSRSFALFYFLNDRLLAVDAVNRPKEFMFAKRMLLQGLKPNKADLANDVIPIQDVLGA